VSDETLPKGWLEVPFEELLVKLTNGTTTTQHKEPPGIPVSRIETISEAKINFQKVRYIRDISPEIRERFILEAGDILFSHINSDSHLGKCALYKGGQELLHGMNLLLMRVSSAATPEFIEQYLTYLRARGYFIQIAQHAVNQSSLNQTKINRIPIPLPPLAEQKRIVAKIEELFSELEAGEASLRQARRQLGVYRQSLLKQAFEGKLTQKWRTQNPAKLGKPLIASTTLDVEPGPLPAGWAWQTLLEVADVTGGLTKNAKRDSLPKRIPYLRVANVYSNELRLDEIKDIGVTSTEAEKVRLLKGDLLIVEGNGSLDQIGRVAAWNGSVPDCGHQNHLIRARCHPNAHYAFVLMFLLSPHGRDVIEKQAASTSGLHTLSVSKVQRLPVPLCSLPEQQEIVRVLDEQFEAIERNERELEAALQRSEALRQSILKKAFTGRLVPQDPADEPASALLARLLAERISKPVSKRQPARQS
jgi:type I restriction enzyme S subunit